MSSASNSGSAVPIHVGGQDITTETKYAVTNPSTGAMLYWSSSACAKEAETAIDTAAAALPSWASSKPWVRRDILNRAADTLERRKDEFISYMAQETGATERTGAGNIHIAVGLLRDIAGRVTESLSGFMPVCEQKGTSAFVVKEPYGVVLAMAPWNAPYVLGVRSIAYALGAGNTVVFKGSELSPRCMWAIAQTFKEAGLPDGCLNTIYTRREDAPEVTELLVAHPAVRKINFTGSTAVGSMIASLAGKHVKPCLMELGGKASAIVLDDADLQKAASHCAAASFSHAGQICMSTERVLVQSSIYDSFLSALTRSTIDLFPDSASPPVLIQPAAVDRTRRLVQDALTKGAHLVHGNVDSDKDAAPNTLRPIILAGVTKEMDVYDTETFAPVVCVFRVEDDSEAVAIANDTEYGLSGSVYTENLSRGFSIAKRISSGAIHINSSSIHNEPTLPHGGVKKSGWGRFNANWGIEEFLQTKTITFEGNL